MHRKHFWMLLLILSGVFSHVYAQEQIDYKQIDTTQLSMEVFYHQKLVSTQLEVVSTLVARVGFVFWAVVHF
ncbi:MAG: hypothetical protein ACJART_000354 [Maribacter sp.]|jgi:hypothetical protein